jgi:Flp pilus assembly protein CpaB
VLIIGGVVVVLVVANLSGGGGLAAITGGGETTTVEESAPVIEPMEPTPSPTPSFVPVVVAKVRLPVGQILTAQLLDIELRPVNNVALQGGYTFTSTENLINRIVKVEVSKGQEILQPMIALNPTDVSSFGSDLALYVPQGEVAVAFPIDRFTGASLAMRPGDQVDVIMTLRTVEIDPEFRSALPNNVERVIQSALLAGQQFLFPPVQEGRLEFIPEVNQVAAIVPNSTDFVLGQDWFPGSPIPKRVTQLTVQQANVLFVGTWVDPRVMEREQEIAQANAEATAQAGEGGEEGGAVAAGATPTPIPSRLEDDPDMIILSMPIQDALALKYARERGVQISLVLRSPGDETAFVTTSVSLPQIIDQGGLAVPQESDFDLYMVP